MRTAAPAGLALLTAATVVVATPTSGASSASAASGVEYCVKGVGAVSTLRVELISLKTAAVHRAASRSACVRLSPDQGQREYLPVVDVQGPHQRTLAVLDPVGPRSQTVDLKDAQPASVTFPGARAGKGRAAVGMSLKGSSSGQYEQTRPVRDVRDLRLKTSSGAVPGLFTYVQHSWPVADGGRSGQAHLLDSRRGGLVSPLKRKVRLNDLARTDTRYPVGQHKKASTGTFPVLKGGLRSVARFRPLSTPAAETAWVEPEPATWTTSYAETTTGPQGVLKEENVYGEPDQTRAAGSVTSRVFPRPVHAPDLQFPMSIGVAEGVLTYGVPTFATPTGMRGGSQGPAQTELRCQGTPVQRSGRGYAQFSAPSGSPLCTLRHTESRDQANASSSVNASWTFRMPKEQSKPVSLNVWTARIHPDQDACDSNSCPVTLKAVRQPGAAGKAKLRRVDLQVRTSDGQWTSASLAKTGATTFKGRLPVTAGKAHDVRARLTDSTGSTYDVTIGNALRVGKTR